MSWIANVWGEEKARKGGWGQVRTTLDNEEFVGTRDPLNIFEQGSSKFRALLQENSWQEVKNGLLWLGQNNQRLQNTQASAVIV